MNDVIEQLKSIDLGETGPIAYEWINKAISELERNRQEIARLLAENGRVKEKADETYQEVARLLAELKRCQYTLLDIGLPRCS